MKNILRNTILITLTIISIIQTGCKKKEEPEPLAIEETKNLNHKWYYITKKSIEETDLPQNAPLVMEKPWTEALRISCIAQGPDNGGLDSSEEGTPKVFALINRLGILTLTGEKSKLYEDQNFFQGQSADKIVFMNGTPIFSLYRNSFFNESADSSGAYKPFLLQFDVDSGVFYPILSYENLGFGAEDEITDFLWNGIDWYCSVKKTDSSSTEFSYIKWKPDTNLLTISPEESLITVMDSSEEEFREMRSPKSFNEAPERIKKLLSTLPEDFSFYIQVKNAGGPSPRTFVRGKINDAKNPVTAVSQLSDSWCGALFPDGTLYLNGILYGRKALNKGKTVAMRLPKLPEGFTYTDFGISGTYFYGAWEENSFYKTGRSGFIQIDLDKLLYGSK